MFLATPFDMEAGLLSIEGLDDIHEDLDDSGGPPHVERRLIRSSLLMLLLFKC